MIALENILNKKDQTIQSLEKELENRVTAEEFIQLQSEIEDTNTRVFVINDLSYILM